jgi:hypothetical protein
MDKNPFHIRHEIVRRQRREALATLAALEEGELYHPMSQEDYQALLVRSIAEDDQELAELEGETWPED